jgi:hypothetical protein
MKKILAGMLSPEKRGVSGSRWVTIEEDTVTISNRDIYIARINDLKLQGYEIVQSESEVLKIMVRYLS